MSHSQHLAELEAALICAASPEQARSMQRYFPVPLCALGVPNPRVAEIAKAFAAKHPELGPEGYWELAESLMTRRPAYHETVMLASALAMKAAGRIKDDGLLDRFRLWLETSVTNWAQCDDLCIKTICAYLRRREYLLPRIGDWSQSESPWCRRASNVAWVKFIGRSAHLELRQALDNCRRLLGDPDDYVQKGIGWLLKVTAGCYPNQVIEFIEENSQDLQRGTLRYAIEKMPAATRRRLLDAARH